MKTSSPSRPTPASVPATIVSGSPIASSRRGTTYSRRKAARSIRDASEKSTTASVASATQRTVSLPIVGSSQPRTSSLDQDAAGDEHHRSGDHRPREPSRDRRVREDEEGERDEAGSAHRQSPSAARDDAAEAEVRRRGVDRLPLSRSGSITEAVVRRAQVRAALDHAARHRLTGKGFGRGDPWISWHAARALHLVRVSCREPVGRPLPDVPGHLEEAVAVRLEARNGRGPLVSVQLQVLPRELALPRVGHRLAVGEVLVAPREDRAVETTPCCELPLGLGRQLLLRPRRVGLGVLVRDVDDGMGVAAVDRRALTPGSLPVRAGHVLPPVAVVVQVDRARGSAEYERAGYEELRIRVGIERRVERALGQRYVLRLADEPAELRRSDRCLVHPEAVDRDVMNRALLGVEVLGAHRERAAGNPAHARTRRLPGRVCRASLLLPGHRFLHQPSRRSTPTASPLRSGGAPRV